MSKRSLVASVVMCLLAVPAWAQDKPADNMQILRDKLRADKKLVVAEALPLTEAEAKAFWPVYDAYQKDLAGLNDRMIQLIKDYAATYETMNSEAATKLINTYVDIERQRVKLMESYLPKFRKVLPAKAAARYYQIENKIRAVVNYELAQAIPLVK
jgi:hypothetical protein